MLCKENNLHFIADGSRTSLADASVNYESFILDVLPYFVYEIGRHIGIDDDFIRPAASQRISSCPATYNFYKNSFRENFKKVFRKLLWKYFAKSLNKFRWYLTVSAKKLNWKRFVNWIGLRSRHPLLTGWGNNWIGSMK